jgi:NitT/TauT family transport system permease protein
LKKEKQSTRSKTLWVGASIILGLALWVSLSWVVGNQLILPGPLLTMQEFLRIISAEDFFRVINATFLRVLLSFSLALLFALVLAIPSGLFSRFYQLLSGPTKVMRAIPTMGVILFTLVWLDSEGAPFVVCALVVFPLLYEGIVGAIRSLDPGLIELHRVYRVPFFRQVWQFYLPSILPAFRGTLVAALGLNLKVMVAAEVLSQPAIAIGTAFQIERANLNTAGIFAWSLIVILLNVLLDLILTPLKRYSRHGTAEKNNGRG